MTKTETQKDDNVLYHMHSLFDGSETPIYSIRKIWLDDVYDAINNNCRPHWKLNLETEKSIMQNAMIQGFI